MKQLGAALLSLSLVCCATQQPQINGLILRDARYPAEITMSAEDTFEQTQQGQNIDGLWALYDFECPKGSSLSSRMENFKKNPEYFAQFIFDRNTVTARAKDLSTNCKIEFIGSYSLEGSRIIPDKFIKSIEKCPGKPDKIDTNPKKGAAAPFLYRQSSGETELVIQGGAGICSDNAPGFIVLRHMSMG